MFDYAIALSAELAFILKRNIQLQLLTDRKSQFEVICKGSRKSEKKLKLDKATTREGFRDKVLSNIGFIRSSANIVDGLTKQMSPYCVQ